MYAFEIPEPVGLETLGGRKYVDQHEEQIKLPFRAFVMDRIDDSAFVSHIKSPLEQIEFALAARADVQAWPEKPGEVGLLEDEMAKALKRATEHPSKGYDHSLMACQLPHMKAVQAGARVKPEKDAESSPDGD